MANLYVYEQGTTLDYKNENFIKQCKNTRDTKLNSLTC